MKRFIYIIMALALAGCSNEVINPEAETGREVIFDSDIVGFKVTADPALGESESAGTRANVEGNDFLNGDLIRLKVVCPFTSTSQRGESTDGNSSDGFYLLKRAGSAWERVMSSDGFDISATYSKSDSPALSSYLEAQQTPFVYTAITWTEEKLFLARTGGTVAAPTNSLIDQYCNVFHANQTKEKHYLASDVLWAQTYRQTGAWNIHLSFEHKMACLYITPLVDGVAPSAHAVLTLEGMPDIDQAEIVIGDYYADASKVNSNYGYRQKSSCKKENHGKVIGVAVIDEAAARAKTYSLTGNPMPAGGSYNTNSKSAGTAAWGTILNTGIYTAHPLGNGTFRLIVPPCVLDQEATFWLRDGEKRYSATLTRKEFKEGELYPVNLTFTTPAPPSQDGGDGE